MVNTVYRSFMRRVRWAMAHAIKLEPDLDMDGPIAKHWFRLKEVATEHEISKQRYDIKHDKGLRLCNNNKVSKLISQMLALNAFESVVSQNVARTFPTVQWLLGFILLLQTMPETPLGWRSQERM